MILYFACESLSTLEWFTLIVAVKAIMKLNLGHSDRLGKKLNISPHGSCSPDNTEFGHFNLSYCFAEDGKEMS